MHSLGFGNLNKVIMEFETSFWSNNSNTTNGTSSGVIDGGAGGGRGGVDLATKDFFGVVGEHTLSPLTRGRGFMYWNIERFAQRPILTAVLSGAFADESERMSEEELVG